MSKGVRMNKRGEITKYMLMINKKAGDSFNDDT
jgi:hypothetical protein